MTALYIFLGLLAVGFIFGQINEQQHLTALKKAEAELAHITIVNTKYCPDGSRAGTLVNGNVVVAVDYFKVFVAGLKSLIGGRLGAYETLMERARREAIIRMKREAEALGATHIANVRVAFSAIGQQPASSGVELLAYGTAVK